MRHLTWLLSLVLLLSCSHGLKGDNGKGWGVAEPIVALQRGEYDQLVIVGTNDFHGYLRTVEGEVGGEKVLLGGAEWFGGYVSVLEKKFGDRLILLDGGDMYQGTIDSNMFLGASVVDYYNLLPYRALAVGNHEFDYGAEKKGGNDPLGAIKARMRQSKHPFVQANIFDKKTGKLWKEKNLFSSVMVKAGDYKIGILGLTTTSTPGKTLPKNVERFEFRGFEQPALEEAKRLRAQGAELVLVTTHEGEGKPGDPIFKFLHALPKGTVDAVVSGHSHTEVHEFVNEVPVIQSKTRGIYFGRIDLFVNKKTRKLEPSLTHIHDMHQICGSWFKNLENCDFKAAKDAIGAGKAKVEDFLPLRAPMYEGEQVKPVVEIRQILKPYLAKADARRSELLGEASADFDWYPSGESEMGTLILDSFHERFPQAKVILVNGGGIRRRLYKGHITYGDLYEMCPFDNYVALVKVTGKELKELVKPLISGAHIPPAIWGVRVTYFDRDHASFDRDVNGDGKKEKWERDRMDAQIGLVWEKNGEPVKDNEEFLLGTLDYLAAGGDNLAHVFDQIPMSRRKYFQVGPRDLMAEYLRKHPGIKLPRKDEMHLRAVK